MARKIEERNKNSQDAFTNASGEPYQPLEQHDIIKTQGIARDVLQELIVTCIDKLDIVDAEVGDFKELTRAFAKAIRDYNGDMRRVTDYVRAKIIINSPQAVLAILNGNEFQEALDTLGIKIVSLNNLFEEPKDNTGYRCLNYKLAVPVGEDPITKETRYHIVELQVAAEQLESIYHTTHPYKSSAEAIMTHAFNRTLTRQEATLQHLSFKACRFYNGVTMRDSGYDVLFRDQDVHAKYAITNYIESRMKRSLENMGNLLSPNRIVNE